MALKEAGFGRLSRLLLAKAGSSLAKRSRPKPAKAGSFGQEKKPASGRRSRLLAKGSRLLAKEPALAREEPALAKEEAGFGLRKPAFAGLRRLLLYIY